MEWTWDAKIQDKRVQRVQRVKRNYILTVVQQLLYPTRARGTLCYFMAVRLAEGMASQGYGRGHIR
jgi:hypothetical protein